ncbi:MAG: hypothetical protein IIC50_17965, partial [Planctomycetes bacterium]|nr:hypothetical protein [Planctomycetota bacterium]
LEIVRHLEEDDSPGICLVWLILAMVHHRCIRLQQALFWYERIQARKPHPLVYNEMADVYVGLKNFTRALQYRTQALELAPDCPNLQARVATDLISTGFLEEGLKQLQALVRDHPREGGLHVALFWFRHYLSDVEPETLFEEVCLWGRRHMPRGSDLPFTNVRDPNRRLRIGYVSGDFRRSSVAYTLEALLDGHDAASVEVIGYGNVTYRDDVTERLRSKFDRYRDILKQSDPAVAEQIRRDEIDVLVAVGGHVDGHRLGVFALKPAPVQVDYGGLCTSGMSQIGYRLTDRLLDPPEMQPTYVEKLVYLPEGYGCYRPSDQAPVVGPLPAGQRGHITFGVFNSRLKINPGMIALWVAILNQVPASRLLLKFPGGGDKPLVERLLTEFSQAGLDPQRVTVRPMLGLKAHFALYNEVDIALDTYPYNGFLTTLEGLWMGVPMVTLTGRRHTSHFGLSILTRVGLSFFVAHSEQAYVAKAVALAGGTESLALIRASCRPRMEASVLCDAPRYARHVEHAYRAIWEDYCQSPSAIEPVPITVNRPHHETPRDLSHLS